MSKIKSKLLILLIFAITLLSFGATAYASDLSEPSDTIGDSGLDLGQLKLSYFVNKELEGHELSIVLKNTETNGKETIITDKYKEVSNEIFYIAPGTYSLEWVLWDGAVLPEYDCYFDKEHTSITVDVENVAEATFIAVPRDEMNSPKDTVCRLQVNGDFDTIQIAFKSTKLSAVFADTKEPIPMGIIKEVHKAGDIMLAEGEWKIDGISAYKNNKPLNIFYPAGEISIFDDCELKLIVMDQNEVLDEDDNKYIDINGLSEKMDANMVKYEKVENKSYILSREDENMEYESALEKINGSYDMETHKFTQDDKVDWKKDKEQSFVLPIIVVAVLLVGLGVYVKKR